jgi:alanine dehydrogenase
MGHFASAKVLMGATMPETPVVLLSGADLRRLLRPQTTIRAPREAYSAPASNRDDQGRSVVFTVEGGSIPFKSGLLPGSHLAFASKANVNLPDDAKPRGLPTIQGIVVVPNAKHGRPLAVMNSVALTGIRTAATAALAAQSGADRAAIIGCGAQARYELDAMRSVFALKAVRVFDTARAEAFAAANSPSDCSTTAAPRISAAVADADVCITCTTCKASVLAHDLTGCFIAAVGADNPEKHEIAPGLMQLARILVDDVEACASGGENHALRLGVVTKDRVHADLAELASGRKQGRFAGDEHVIFDSSGSDVQDVAAAWAAYQEAVRTGVGLRFDLSGNGA